MVSQLLQKSLQDIVKGVRSHKKNEAEYVANTVIPDIKDDFKTTDHRVKTIAVQKVTYLAMLGYEMEWAAFRIVEVMSDADFQRKRIGYLAATQVFNSGTDVIALTVNLFKKDMQSSNQYEAGLALSTLANICNQDLARDLVSDVVSLLGSGRAYIRKKVVLTLFKIFLQFPDALRPTFPRLKEKLDDSDPGVVAATVNTICELARKNPGNYLAMAPQFFKLLQSINNNWTLIKIVKLFGALTPLEPRLARKLVEPLMHLINTTPAKSLLYECLNTVCTGFAKHQGILKLALEKMKMFVEAKDQNLKYLGLLGLVGVMKIHPKYLSDLKETVIACLEDPDLTIRYRALDLISGMVTKKNIQGIVRKLMEHVHQHEGDYKRDLIYKVLECCKQNNYENVTEFEWYMRVLMELVQCELKQVKHGKALAGQFMDVLIRVKVIRRFGIRCMASVLQSSEIFTEGLDTIHSDIYEVLNAAAWLCGEFVEELKDIAPLLEALLQPAAQALPARAQSVFVVTVAKVYTHVINDSEKFPEAHTKKIRENILKGLKPFLCSSDVEVQERATQVKRMILMHSEQLEKGDDMSKAYALLYKEELIPVAETTQKKVPIPAGLDLDEVIVADADWDSSSSEASEDAVDRGGDDLFAGTDAFNADLPPGTPGYHSGGTQSPYLIKDSSKKKLQLETEAVASPKGERLSDLGMGSWKEPDRKKKKKDKKDKEKGQGPVVSAVMDLPEGVTADTPEEDKKGKKVKGVVKKGKAMLHEYDNEDSIEAKLNQDLSEPLRGDEVLPQIQEYKKQDPNELLAQQLLEEKEDEGKSRRSKGKKKKGKDKDDVKKKKKKKDTGKDDDKKKKSKKDKGDKDSKKDKKDKKTDTTITDDDKTKATTEDKKSDKVDKDPKKSKDKDATKKKKKDRSDKKKSKDKNEDKGDKKKTKSSTTEEPSEIACICGRTPETIIWYEPSEVKAEGTTVFIPIKIKNLQEQKCMFEGWELGGTMNTSIDKGFDNVTIEGGKVEIQTLKTTSKDIIRNQELDASLKINREGKSAEATLKIPFGCSLFLTALKITPEEFSVLVGEKGMKDTSDTVQIPPNVDTASALKRICQLLHVRGVGKPTEVANLYGKSSQGHHVCFTIKAESDWEIQVDIKCIEDGMGSSLMKEIRAAFQIKQDKAPEIDDFFA